MKILFISANSVTIEIENNDAYFTEEYEIFLNEKKYTSNINVISFYDLNPNTEYKVMQNGEALTFKTLNKKLIYFKKDYDDTDDTKYIQASLDKLSSDETLVLSEKYNVRNLYVRDNNSIYLTKNAILIGELHREKYDILSENEYLNSLPLGTWEGRKDDSFASIINFLGVHDASIYGEGEINYFSQNTDWWQNHRVKRIARRPKGIFIHTSKNITLEGIKVCNTPSWNIHPFYSQNLKFLNLRLENPWDSPTTDGCDPEACDNVLIAGNVINVGDDCIAIKSSKIELASIYHTPSSNIIIRNNFMKHGHAGVTLGSENSGGINNVYVSQCLFNNTDRGLRIKSQRGRGKDAIIKDITFDNVVMDGVKSPFVINGFYKAGNDEVDYRFDYGYQSVTDLTPSLETFEFKNIKCMNACYGLAFIHGLPENKIKNVTFKNIDVTYNKDTEEGAMAMSLENPKFKNIGIYARNLEKLTLINVIFKDAPTEKYILDNVDTVEEK